jgi:cholesterol oxidase
MKYDYIVIGSGFGGSVSALRLTEKGYSVCVIEVGKRFRQQDFAKSNWQTWKYLWAPSLFCYGIQRIHPLNDVIVLAGSGVGGGSLVYANTLLVPPRSFFQDPQWVHLMGDWEEELMPHYNTAKKMLGVITNPELYETDEMLRDYAKEINRLEYFKPSEVGVFMGEPGVTVPDPYFGGRGPSRTGCTRTGHCMVGCRDGGKNSLDKNYLYLAEQDGLEIVPEHKVIDVQVDPDGGYIVTAKKITDFLFKRKREFRSSGIVFAAGVLGTLELLMRCKENGHLPEVSDQLGNVVRTNSEIIAAVTTRKNRDYSKGITLTSGLWVDDNTHIELGRYPVGSDVMSFLATVQTDGGTRVPRILKHFWTCIRHPLIFARTLWPFGWAKRTNTLTVMQNLDNSIRLYRKRRWWAFFKKGFYSENTGKKIPSYIPVANEAARAMAKRMEGYPQSCITEVLLNIPLTAHILGGCVMGESRESGVIDRYHRVFGYENMYVADASAVSANLGVNPSLTIAALAERAMSYIPEKKKLE